MTDHTIITAAEIYDELLKVTTPDERDHHASDLYIKATPATAEIIKKYEYRRLVTTFRDQTDPRRALWYDIPFAYMPYWEGNRTI